MADYKNIPGLRPGRLARAVSPRLAVPRDWPIFFPAEIHPDFVEWFRANYDNARAAGRPGPLRCLDFASNGFRFFVTSLKVLVERGGISKVTTDDRVHVGQLQHPIRPDDALGELRQMIDAARARVAATANSELTLFVLAHRKKNPIRGSLRRASRLRRRNSCDGVATIGRRIRPGIQLHCALRAWLASSKRFPRRKLLRHCRNNCRGPTSRSKSSYSNWIDPGFTSPNT